MDKKLTKQNIYFAVFFALLVTIFLFFMFRKVEPTTYTAPDVPVSVEANPVDTSTTTVSVLPNNSIESTSATSTKGKTKLLPQKLKITSIGVNANIESLGVTVDGAMDSPVGPLNVGWYNLGPKIGDVGSAVIDGHFGWKDGIPAVFDNLSKLKIGDKIQVVDESGITITFVVRGTEVISADADAKSVFTSTDGLSHLNLITCSGTWDTTTKNRPSRLVVFTDRAV